MLEGTFYGPVAIGTDIEVHQTDAGALLRAAPVPAPPPRRRPPAPPRPPELLADLLAPVEATIVLDDVHLSRQDLEHVMGMLRSSPFPLAADTPRRWSGGRSERLPGLDADAALELIARELGRPLGPADATPARLAA